MDNKPDPTKSPTPPTPIDEALTQITSQPKRQYTQQEIDEARDNLALMNDRVFLVTFMDNKNNHIIKGIADAVRKIHALPPIPQVEQTRVQNISLLDVLGRGMIGDLIGWGEAINIALEVQRDKQDSYAVRGTLTSSNAMRMGFNAGADYADAPDVIGINILEFKLPQLEHRKEFASRIVRAEYESREPFLADKYSDYYIELPKMNYWVKGDMPEAYHDLWDLCCIFRAKIKEHKEVIRMQAISNPVALELPRETIKTVAPNDFVNTTLDRKSELEQLKDYILQQGQKRETTGMEKMMIVALQSNTPVEFVEAMRVKAGISDARFAELILISENHVDNRAENRRL